MTATLEPGLCACGCGQCAPLATRGRSKLGQVKGHPLRYVHGHTGGRAALSAAERLWDWVEIRSAHECWPWTGHTIHGYGALSTANGGHAKAHRVAYEIAKGPIPPGLLVLHSCDNPPCCNPDHLSVGTTQQNSREAAERNRMVYGEDHINHKLTEADVRHIRLAVTQGANVGQLARQFGVATPTIRKAASGATWARVTA